MVYMLITDPETNKATVCAGAIINKMYITTAAHCFCKSGLCERIKDATTSGYEDLFYYYPINPFLCGYYQTKFYVFWENTCT